MNALGLLRIGREKIAKVGWHRHWFAVTKHGMTCMGWDPNACAFCAIGALDAGAYDHRGSKLLDADDDAFSEAILALTNALPPGFESVPDYNDSRESVDDVLALYDRAIAKLEAEL